MISHSLPPSLVLLETSNFANPSHSLRRFSVTLDLVVMSFISFTAEEIAFAPKLEPALEGLLLSANAKQQMICAFRVQEITSTNLMVALDSTEQGFMATCKQAFGIDTKSEDFAHKREWAKLNMVWKQARITCDTKDRVDAVKRAHGEPVSFLTADWTSLLREKQQRGKIQDNELPAQRYYEAFEESLHDGTIQAQTLSHVVSIAEEQKQRAGRPELPKQPGLHLDSTLTSQTKRRYMSSMPANTEALRTKYEVLTNLWLLAQSRKMYADFTENTWPKFLEELLNENNFWLQRDIQGEVWATPAWTHCLKCEYRLRKEALRPCFEEGFSIQEALWSEYTGPAATQTSRRSQHSKGTWPNLKGRTDPAHLHNERSKAQAKARGTKVHHSRSRSPRFHACAGCNTANVPYVDCLCLETA